MNTIDSYFTNKLSILAIFGILVASIHLSGRSWPFMNEQQQRAAAKQFSNFWKGKGYEKGQSQPFWISLLTNVFGVKNIDEFIKFEDQVMLDRTSFIDAKIPSTNVLIEQKGLEKDLRKPIKQADGTLLTPFQQAKRYAAELPYSQRPRWIVTCNFKSFLVYDMENPSGQPEEILLENLPKEYYRLSFLIDDGNPHLKREMEISIKAGEIVGVLYEELLNQYKDPTNDESLKSLNMLCVRLVFCLYAEDAGIFGRKNMFHDYLSGFDARHLRKSLIELFVVLNTEEDKRDPYLDEALAEFPYVNGGLFSDIDLEIPQLNERIKELLLQNASDDFDWSEISPTIFGAVFESTLNPETRRSGGMHYTSIENIHKVIDPLFLDDLKSELKSIIEIPVVRTREKRLVDFQNKISSLYFLDPACGSGNFLTEAYISLRRLENEVLSNLLKGQMTFASEGEYNPIKVSIGQFYGIEINDFAVTVARTALWIAESQMMKETEDIVHMNLDFLPLKSYSHIVEGNALRIDWESVVPKEKLNYIMGNPPFVGARLMSVAQKEDMSILFGKLKGIGNLDFVTAWFYKSSEYIKNSNNKVAFVSTNSITQGEQASILWNLIFSNEQEICYAYRTFKWNSESNDKAAVHCIIVGFRNIVPESSKYIYNDSMVKKVRNINAYLIDAPNVFIGSRVKPICSIPEIVFGSMPNDGGFLSNYTSSEKDEILNLHPQAVNLFRRILGSDEFINSKERWCLWLKDTSPDEIKKIPPIYDAVNNVLRIRSESKREATRKLATTPMLFGEIRQPDGDYLLIPRVSSENRKYIPIGFVSTDVIASDSSLIVPAASIFHFGVLTSNVHMSWMRVVAGRLKSDYRYSGKIVYNNFPWPEPNADQKNKIEQTAQAILDARELYPNSSLADLYDEITMPPELRKAHQQNDAAVMEAYGFDWRKMSEAECVAELMKLYQKYVNE